jgi:hypothetical protein
VIVAVDDNRAETNAAARNNFSETSIRRALILHRDQVRKGNPQTARIAFFSDEHDLIECESHMLEAGSGKDSLRFIILMDRTREAEEAAAARRLVIDEHCLAQTHLLGDVTRNKGMSIMSGSENMIRQASSQPSLDSDYVASKSAMISRSMSTIIRTFDAQKSIFLKRGRLSSDRLPIDFDLAANIAVTQAGPELARRKIRTSAAMSGEAVSGLTCSQAELQETLTEILIWLATEKIRSDTDIVLSQTDTGRCTLISMKGTRKRLRKTTGRPAHQLTKGDLLARGMAFSLGAELLIEESGEKLSCTLEIPRRRRASIRRKASKACASGRGRSLIASEMGPSPAGDASS